ncbi:hypothetical protein BM1_07587 [Bipolaris maydis]|nr:hypothetical protein BM1_07587 [Bipolaris maydis]
MHGSVINSPQVVALYGDDSILVVESAENWWPRAQSRGHVVDFAQFRMLSGELVMETSAGPRMAGRRQCSNHVSTVDIVKRFATLRTRPKDEAWERQDFPLQPKNGICAPCNAPHELPVAGFRRGRQSGVGAVFRPKDKKHLQALSTETRRERGKHRPSSYFAASFVRLLAATTRSRRKARLDREGQPHLRLPRDGILGFGRLDRLGRDITLDMELGVPALRLFHTYTPTTRRVHGAQDNHSWRQSQRPCSMTRGPAHCPHNPSIKALEADETEH